MAFPIYKYGKKGKGIVGGRGIKNYYLSNRIYFHLRSN